MAVRPERPRGGGPKSRHARELGAALVNGSNLITIHANTDFLMDFDGTTIVDFAPVFDEYLEALPVE